MCHGQLDGRAFTQTFPISGCHARLGGRALTKTILTVLSFSNPVFDSACDAVEPMFTRL